MSKRVTERLMKISLILEK